MKKTLLLILVACLLLASCATEKAQTSSVQERPFDRQSWWGMDPTCSPGCPAGQSSSW